MRKFAIILMLSILTLSLGLLIGCENKLPADGIAMKVLQITDVHMQNKKINNEDINDRNCFATINMLIDESNPDLIMVTGDVTSEKDNQPAFKKFAEFMESKKIKWGFTFGNHDAEGDWSKEEINQYLLTLEYCIYERGDESVYGYGNSYLNVKDAQNKDVMTLFMLDSNMYNEDKTVEGYDYFHKSQIDWYERTVLEIAKEVNKSNKKVLPSLAFFHIPFIEMTTAYNEAFEKSEILYGKRLEAECPSLVEDSMFETMERLGSTKGVFFGHDHMNNYSVNLNGIRLTYGSTTDHALYFAPQKGGTEIVIYNNGTFKQRGLYRDFGMGDLKTTELF